MSDRNPSSTAGGREYGRVLLVLCCAAALVLSATLVPALAGDAPADSLVFVESDSDDDSGPTAGAGGGGLGALNAGDRTDVGGPIGSAGDNPFQSLGTETHFTVQSTTGAYWRTGSYDSYTGTGWEQTGESNPYDGSVAVDGLRDTTVSYEVTLNRSATAVPTVWRPQRVSLEEDLDVTPGRALRAADSVPAGTTYTGQSVQPPTDPAVLRAAGRDYPVDVVEQYTRLPDSTPDRVATFTDELTADASSPYGEAVRIERWLESNKTYSLDASHTDGADVADQFIFEMDVGYCEYFATTMVAMLRSQDVPARYVVGYSTGQQTDPNSYTVRGMNAHAWVEVYFPEVGWVTFDPTPGTPRLQEEQRAFEAADQNGSYTPNETGSPGERASLNTTPTSTPESTPTSGSTPTPGSTADEQSSTANETGGQTQPDSSSPDATNDSDESNDTSAQTGYAIDLNTTPVPGRSVNVTVTNSGTPATGVTVFFNDDPVGTTDDDGSVVSTVPYTENFTVSISASDVERRASLGVDTLPGFGDDRRFALDDPPLSVAANESNTSRSYRLDTNVSLSVTGEPVTGNEVLVTAAIRGVPVRDATVELGGERVAETDTRGRARLTLPDDPGNVTLVVARDEVRGEETLQLRGLRLAVEPALPLALPLQPVVVQARLGNQSLAGANVTVAGEQVGQTGVDGTLQPTLPFRDSATVAVSKYGQTRQQAVTGLYTNAALVGLVPGLAVLALAVAAVRRGLTPRAVLAALSRLVDRLVRATLGVLVGAASLVDDLLRGALDALARAVDAVRALVARRRSVAEVLAGFRAWLSTLAASSRSRVDDVTRRVTPGALAGTATTAAEEDSSYRSIREAWDRFLGVATVPRARTKSPGEIADHAVAIDGLPADAVATLRDVFREVEYGGRDPRDRLQRVEEAISDIEAHLAARRERAANDEGESPPAADTPEATPSTPGEAR